MRANIFIYFLTIVVASALHLSHQTINPSHEVTLEQTHDFLFLIPLFFEGAVAAGEAAALGSAVAAGETATVGAAVTSGSAVTAGAAAANAVGTAVSVRNAIGQAVSVGKAVGKAVKQGKAIGKVVQKQIKAVGQAVEQGNAIGRAVTKQIKAIGQSDPKQTISQKIDGTKELEPLAGGIIAAAKWGFQHFFNGSTPETKSKISAIDSQKMVTSQECSLIAGQCFEGVNESKSFDTSRECMNFGNWCFSKVPQIN